MTIKTNALETLAGDKRLDVDKIVNGSAKVFANYNSVTATLNQSQNVSSLVDNAVGRFTVNFTNAMTTGGYSAPTSENGTGAYPGSLKTTIQAPNSVDLEAWYGSSGATRDLTNNSVAVFGDLA